MNEYVLRPLWPVVTLHTYIACNVTLIGATRIYVAVHISCFCIPQGHINKSCRLYFDVHAMLLFIVLRLFLE